MPEVSAATPQFMRPPAAARTFRLAGITQRHTPVARREAGTCSVDGGSSSGRKSFGVIVDEVFLGGPASQRRWRTALDGLDVLWVGVRCDGAVAAGRETARGDRFTGMATSQAELVHRGLVYDLEVDTTHTESLVCARRIAARLTPRG